MKRISVGSHSVAENRRNHRGIRFGVEAFEFECLQNDVSFAERTTHFFRYQDTVNSAKWQAIYSIGGTDTATDTAVTAVVSTRTNFKITIDSSRIARMYHHFHLYMTDA
jgi:hypothetical protein